MVMSEKQQMALVPQYLCKFTCIGPECEDSCCVGWRVTIDQDTYKKYNRVRDIQLTPQLNKKISRVRSNQTKENFAKVKLNKDGSCPFLNEEKLCQIQLNLGEDYLSNTCATYPRTIHKVNNVIEQSATMSCPEVARLALLNPDGIEFDEITEYSKRSISQITVLTEDKKFADKPQKYLWELRIFTISLLQNRNYSIADRMIILGMFYQKLQEYIDQNKVEQIPQLIATYSNLISDGSLKGHLSEIPTNNAIQMELCKEMVDERFSTGITNRRYLECLAEFLWGIMYTEESKVEDIAKRYNENYSTYYAPFMNEHEYIYENYLVNYVFRDLFPFSGVGSAWDTYVMLIVHYAIIKLHLIGMAGFHKRLDTDHVVKLIQSFAKTIEHNKLYLRNILTLLKNNNYTSMAYMAILIKN